MALIVLVFLLGTIQSKCMAMPDPAEIFAQVNQHGAQVVYNPAIKGLAEKEEDNTNTLVNRRYTDYPSSGRCIIDVSYLSPANERGNDENVNQYAVSALNDVFSDSAVQAILENTELDIGFIITEDEKKLFLITIFSPRNAIVSLSGVSILRIPYAQLWKEQQGVWNSYEYDARAADIAKSEIDKSGCEPFMSEKNNENGQTWYLYGSTNFGGLGVLDDHNIDESTRKAIQRLQSEVLKDGLYLTLKQGKYVFGMSTTIDCAESMTTVEDATFTISYVFLKV